MGKTEKRMARVTGSKISNGMVLCNVQFMHAGGGESGVAVGKPAPGVMWKPEPGWIVAVDYMQDGMPYVSDVMSTADYDQPDDLPSGGMTMQFGESTAITVKPDNGGYSVTIEASNIEVEGSDISLSAETVQAVAESVSVDAGSISLGESGEPLVTDVEAASTNDDGAITSLSVEKTDTTTAE